MNRIFSFVQSELFLSLVGGFALGVAGLAVIKPASADSGVVEAARSISVGAPAHEKIIPAK